MLPRRIEELTLNAWPPLHSLLYDGWILGFSGGYTRRANSIHPLYPSSVPVVEKIVACESTYAARGMETFFKLTSAPDDAALESVLEGLGYAHAALTSVQTVDLAALPSQMDHAVALSTTLESAWFSDFNRLTVTPESLQAAERRLLDSIAPPHVFASVSHNGQTVAVGLAVAERDHVGLFDIVVDSSVRNQGLGRRLCTSLLQWGRQTGAGNGYLAVMADNAPAIHLYERLGFRESYQYWYRHKPNR
jgi:ribosomal protein S18 acetylase RimI-like enzyme